MTPRTHTPADGLDEETLRDVHALLGLLLGEFDRVCRLLGIPYAVYGGTAIGAVRHHGFIPWDDDVDVLMTRPDYERFLDEAPAVLGEGFRLDNLRTRDDFPFMFTKMVLPGTLLVPEADRRSAYRMPFFMDILPVDTIPDDEAAFASMRRATWLWGRLLFVRGTARPYLINASPLTRVMVHSVTTAAHWTLRLLRVTPRSLQLRWESAARRYEHAGTGRMADFTMRDPQNWVITLDELLPTQDVAFEDLTVQLPRQYDAWLRRGYGDYMTVPPPEQQRTHAIHELDLGPYKDRLPS
ncbi:MULTISPECIES: LicD family protein [unclassified Actinomyces]|uniref:LicD family protein n=1 Tax=unclassified Actinomyces TaxID=2609248 RepID=UPI002017126F|nr:MULTISPECIES: LicD family protein [unclassified Actinomyces]MCL3777007.1 LicD family protein [Actinomyces sp. AC-20-1]MCL3789062.1 LicD family protein [Actinomyces sp. 187325]MCL3791424.1 LicD family protein [Actinomyces sp. 186855]MCL3794046.1 LicD family protein [Actinomyces sp. 217892]